jgi:hypothetical protein
MLKFVLFLAWPFIRRYLVNRSAQYSADYLNRRRSARFPQDEEKLPAAPVDRLECPPAILGYSSGDVFWFTMSGMLLGSAFGVVVSYLTRQDK